MAIAMPGRMGSFTYEDEVQAETFKKAAPDKKPAPQKPAPAKPSDPKAAPGGGDLDYAAPYVDEQKPAGEPETKKDSSFGANAADKAVTYKRTTETGGEENKSESSTTVQLGQSSKISHGTKEVHGGNEHERDDEIGGGVRDGKVVIEGGTAQTIRNDKTGTQVRTGAGIDGKELVLKRGETHETYGKNDAGDRTTTGSTSQDVSFGLGPDGGSGSYAASKTDAGGNKSSVGVNAGFEDGMAKAGVSFSRTGADGKGFGVSASVHGGTRVEAGEPVADGDHFVVPYRKTTEKGGDLGGTAHGVGVSAGTTEGTYENGTRVFKTRAEAEEFQKNAAEKLEKDGIDAASAEGALSIPIGESRGVGLEKNEHVGASVSVESGSLSGEKTETTGADTTVKRIGKSVVQVTMLGYGSKNKGAGVGGFGLTTSKGKGSSETSSITVELDLAKPEDKAEYERIFRNHMYYGQAGKVVSSETQTSDMVDDSTSIALVGAGHHPETISEDHVQDATGTHDFYRGSIANNTAHSNSVARTLDGGDESAEAAISARVDNGKLAGYRVAGSTSSDKHGGWNMAHMEGLTGMNDSQQANEGKSSGKWNLSANLSDEAVDEFCKIIAGPGDIDSGSQHDLQEALRAAKTQEDKIRAVTAYVSSDGADAISRLNGGEALKWDVELEGDKNFPGEKGRVDLENRMKSYQAGLGDSRIAGVLLVGLDTEVDALRARRAAVADTKRYADLPNPMRTAELAKIDGQIEQMAALQHAALVAASHNPDGPDVKPGAKPDAHDGKTEHLSPDQLKLHKIRESIGAADAKIAEAEKRIAVDESVLRGEHVKSSTFGDGEESYKEYEAQRRAYGGASRGLAATKAALDGLVDAKRREFIESIDDPRKAAEVGQALLAMVQRQEKLMDQAALDADKDEAKVTEHSV